MSIGKRAGLMDDETVTVHLLERWAGLREVIESVNAE